LDLYFEKKGSYIVINKRFHVCAHRQIINLLAKRLITSHIILINIDVQINNPKTKFHPWI